MDPTLLRLAAQFLGDYAGRLSNDGCNDWDWPAWLGPEARLTVQGQEWQEKYAPPNWLAVQNLSAWLEEESRR